jgi:hypothetical protein
MHARLTTIEVPQDRIDDAPGVIQDQVLPQLQQMDGFSRGSSPSVSVEAARCAVWPSGKVKK